jgi:hypothetical protein
MSRSPSFLSEVDVADSAIETQVVLAAEAKAPAPVPEIGQIVDAFVAAANVGMFSKDPSSGTKAIELVSSESRTPGRMQYTWRAAGLQVGAYRVLLNMLESPPSVSEPLNRISLVSTPDRGTRVRRAELLGSQLAIRAGKPPFAFRSRRHLDNCGEPVVRLEFRRPVNDDELASLLPAFRAWDNVVIRGGFLDEAQDQEVGPDIDAALKSQQTYLAAPNTVEHLFYLFMGNREAFSALLNMAIRFHFDFCPLASLEID